MSESAQPNDVFQAGYDACMRGQSYLTHPEGQNRDEWLRGFSQASDDYAKKYAPAKKLTPEEAWQDLIETSDVTSPAEYPNHALITFEQLREYMASV